MIISYTIKSSVNMIDFFQFWYCLKSQDQFLDYYTLLKRWLHNHLWKSNFSKNICLEQDSNPRSLLHVLLAFRAKILSKGSSETQTNNVLPLDHRDRVFFSFFVMNYIFTRYLSISSNHVLIYIINIVKVRINIFLKIINKLN